MACLDLGFITDSAELAGIAAPRDRTCCVHRPSAKCCFDCACLRELVLEVLACADEAGKQG